MVLSSLAILSLTVLFVFAFAYEEAHAINKIVGYVSEAKKAEALLANQTNSTTTEEEIEVEEYVEDTTNRSDDGFNDTVRVIKQALGIEEEKKQEEAKYTKIIGIQLSRTCLQMEKNNVTSNCPNYNELWQFDNTLPSVSGNLTHNGEMYVREKSDYKDHCNFYQDAFPVLLVIDPDGCWQRERGIKIITIQATSPENLVYKLTANKDIVDEIRELNKENTKSITNRASLDKQVDSLDDRIDDLESKIRNLEDDIDKPRCDKDKITTACNSSLQARNLKFQLRFSVEDLAELRIDLAEAKADYIEATGNVTRTREGLNVITQGTQSSTVVGGYTSLGVGRYVDNCHDATVGSNMTLVVDTINYLLTNCNETNFDSIKTTYKEQTPIYVGNFTWYKYMNWLEESLERCKERC